MSLNRPTLASPAVARDLLEWHARLSAENVLLPADALTGYYETFRQRFGPERLSAVDGEALLHLMHDTGNRDGLVYWLEFKDDAEFPARFGSIAGGSALKFGVTFGLEVRGSGLPSGAPAQDQLAMMAISSSESLRSPTNFGLSPPANHGGMRLSITECRNMSACSKTALASSKRNGPIPPSV